MTARCIRCGSEPMPKVLFCERCWSIVEMEAINRVPVSNVDHQPVTSPWVRMAQSKRLPAKEYTR